MNGLTGNDFCWMCRYRQAERFSLGWEEGTRLAGVVMGLSLYNGIQCDVRFPPIVYKHLLRRPVSFHDLARFDPELHASLCRVRHSPNDVVTPHPCSFRTKVRRGDP
jgi:hypothetical protein